MTLAAKGKSILQLLTKKMSRIGGRRESGPQLPPIVLFGDSLTQYSFFRDDGKGLGQQLAEMYDGVAEVRNEGLLIFSL